MTGDAGIGYVRPAFVGEGHWVRVCETERAILFVRTSSRPWHPAEHPNYANDPDLSEADRAAISRIVEGLDAYLAANAPAGAVLPSGGRDLLAAVMADGARASLRPTELACLAAAADCRRQGRPMTYADVADLFVEAGRTPSAGIAFNVMTTLVDMGLAERLGPEPRRSSAGRPHETFGITPAGLAVLDVALDLATRLAAR